MVTRRPTGQGIAVIGAGLAGAACARALARAGERVTVMESRTAAASGASGNPLGIFHHLYSKDHNLATQWSGYGVVCTRRWLDELAPIARTFGWGCLGKVCGVLQLTEDGHHLEHWDTQGGWIKPAAFVAACLADARDHGALIRCSAMVKRVDTDGVIYFADDQPESFDAVVVCAAQDLDTILADQTFGLNQIRGTVTSFTLPERLSAFSALPCVICASGYATPVIDGQMVVGASYERLPDGLPDPVSNLERLRVIDARLADVCATVPQSDRTSIRSATVDRMPLVGAVLDTSQALTPQMSQLHHLPRNPKVWVLGGLGSRGLTSAPLGAEVITAQLQGHAVPIDARLLKAVDPARFALRQHQRRARF